MERDGEPYVYWPVPTWRKWKVDVWWYFAESRTGRIIEAFGHGWTHMETYWMSSLVEMSGVHRRMFRSGGMYNHLQMTVSSWVWDYEVGEWEEEDHV